jgi:membrane-bound lytic murein transglycosylase MltF
VRILSNVYNFRGYVEKGIGMKRKMIFSLLFISLISVNTSPLYSQEVLRIGCKNIPATINEEINSRKIIYTEGFDAELINLIAQYFDEVEYKIIETKDRITALMNDEVDIVISSLSITEDRKKQIDFSNSYLSNPGLAIITSKKGKYHFINDILQSKAKISVISNTISDTSLSTYKFENKADFTILEFDNNIDAINEI